MGSENLGPNDKMIPRTKDEANYIGLMPSNVLILKLATLHPFF